MNEEQTEIADFRADKPEADVCLALRRLQALVGDQVDPDLAIAFVQDGAPASKARARYNARTRRFYTPPETRTAEQVLAARFLHASKGEPISGPVAIIAIFFRPNYQRIDADNLMKLVMDAATHSGIWRDDCFVTAQASYMELDRDRPRTVIAVCPTESTLRRDVRFRCEICGKMFNRAGAAALKRPPKTCSRECRTKQYLLTRRPARCPICSKEFDRNSSGQTYCSSDCKSVAVNSPARRQKRELQRPWPKCKTCGERVSRREYIQCANCAPKGRKIGSKNVPKSA